ncbi:hypothetical protein [Aneurinibacillus aneurinilyticus]|uniref:hypothetical protein n=1 Tax=Aneurinibacillus aneurinilyticus TaxID=1391 RepID=UPI003525FC0E
MKNKTFKVLSTTALITALLTPSVFAEESNNSSENSPITTIEELDKQFDPETATDDILFADTTEVNEKVSPILNEKVISILEKNNIDFQIIDGNLKLNETSPEAITKVNQLLSQQSQTNGNVSLAATYPTAYVHMRGYDINTSKKFRAATKTALGAAVTEWAKSKGLASPYQIGVAAAAGFGLYYFIRADEENLYFAIKYYYRELGPGRFDGNGNFIGDYEIKKETRVTKNSDYTGGSVTPDVRRSTILEPTF